MNLFNPFKKSLSRKDIKMSYEEIMARPHTYRHSRFWDSVVIDFHNGDQIGIYCQCNSNVCNYYISEKDAWVYMSGETGREFVDGIKEHMTDLEMRELI